MSLRTLYIESQHCCMRNITDMILNYFHQHCNKIHYTTFRKARCVRPQLYLKTYENLTV
jgi:hypothetical protein